MPDAGQVKTAPTQRAVSGLYPVSRGHSQQVPVREGSFTLLWRASGKKDEGREGLLPVHLAFIMQFWTSERQFIWS